VFQGLDLRTARGRRIRSLHQAYAEQFDDQADESVADRPIIQAAILRVAKLQVIVVSSSLARRSMFSWRTSSSPSRRLWRFGFSNSS
jgi:hypothetical protein